MWSGGELVPPLRPADTLLLFYVRLEVIYGFYFSRQSPPLECF